MTVLDSQFFKLLHNNDMAISLGKGLPFDFSSYICLPISELDATSLIIIFLILIFGYLNSFDNFSVWEPFRHPGIPTTNIRR